MNFEKIKITLRKFGEISKLYFKERRLLCFFTYIIIAFFILFIDLGILILDKNLSSFKVLSYFFISVIILYILVNLTFLQLEKRLQSIKISPFKNLLEKITKIETHFNNDLKDKKIIKLLLIIVNIFIIFIFHNIATSTESLFATLLIRMLFLILIFQLAFFIYDINECILLFKEKINNLKK